ncbi:hypothetical protein [Paenibacillus sp. ALJ109b]|uniref:hypothetical protein n=1 Tax=Paenibacillus sp. ALJ109b TaxID=2709068 RepID=UPI0013D1A18D|nr:hypothetical protein [Paenibacillus sp. ALJ109b]NEU62425.1 hypothetical protein [Paenibacillus sp. ALJ109b]
MTEQSGLSELLERIRHDTDEALNNMYDWSEEDFVEFLDRREGLVLAMEPYRSQVNEFDKQYINEILESDILIRARMHFLKEESAEQLRQFGGARVQQRGYQNQYTMDGLFIDKRN